MKNHKISQLDVSQIQKRMFDQETDSMRITVVGGEMPELKLAVDASSITNAVKAGISSIKFPEQTYQAPVSAQNTIKTIEVPTVIKETKIERIEIPVIIKEIEYKEIKVPYETVKIVEIEKPITIKETQILKQNTAETNYLRIVSVVLFITQLISLLYILKAK